MSAPLQSEWWSFERYGKKGEGAMARIERTIEQLGLSAIKTPKPAAPPAPATAATEEEKPALVDPKKAARAAGGDGTSAPGGDASMGTGGRSGGGSGALLSRARPFGAGRGRRIGESRSPRSPDGSDEPERRDDADDEETALSPAERMRRAMEEEAFDDRPLVHIARVARVPGQLQMQQEQKIYGRTNVHLVVESPAVDAVPLDPVSDGFYAPAAPSLAPSLLSKLVARLTREDRKRQVWFKPGVGGGGGGDGGSGTAAAVGDAEIVIESYPVHDRPMRAAPADLYAASAPSSSSSLGDGVNTSALSTRIVPPAPYTGSQRWFSFQVEIRGIRFGDHPYFTREDMLARELEGMYLEYSRRETIDLVRFYESKIHGLRTLLARQDAETRECESRLRARAAGQEGPDEHEQAHLVSLQSSQLDTLLQLESAISLRDREEFEQRSLFVALYNKWVEVRLARAAVTREMAARGLWKGAPLESAEKTVREAERERERKAMQQQQQQRQVEEKIGERKENAGADQPPSQQPQSSQAEADAAAYYAQQQQLQQQYADYAAQQAAHQYAQYAQQAQSYDQAQAQAQAQGYNHDQGQGQEQGLGHGQDYSDYLSSSFVGVPPPPPGLDVASPMGTMHFAGGYAGLMQVQSPSESGALADTLASPSAARAAAGQIAQERFAQQQTDASPDDAQAHYTYSHTDQQQQQQQAFYSPPPPPPPPPPPAVPAPSPSSSPAPSGLLTKQQLAERAAQHAKSNSSSGSSGNNSSLAAYNPSPTPPPPAADSSAAAAPSAFPFPYPSPQQQMQPVQAQTHLITSLDAQQQPQQSSYDAQMQHQAQMQMYAAQQAQAQAQAQQQFQQQQYQSSLAPQAFGTGIGVMAPPPKREESKEAHLAEAPATQGPLVLQAPVSLMQQQQQQQQPLQPQQPLSTSAAAPASAEMAAAAGGRKGHHITTQEALAQAAQARAERERLEKEQDETYAVVARARCAAGGAGVTAGEEALSSSSRRGGHDATGAPRSKDAQALLSLEKRSGLLKETYAGYPAVLKVGKKECRFREAAAHPQDYAAYVRDRKKWEAELDAEVAEANMREGLRHALSHGGIAPGPVRPAAEQVEHDASLRRKIEKQKASMRRRPGGPIYRPSFQGDEGSTAWFRDAALCLPEEQKRRRDIESYEVFCRLWVNGQRVSDTPVSRLSFPRFRATFDAVFPLSLVAAPSSIVVQVWHKRGGALAALWPDELLGEVGLPVPEYGAPPGVVQSHQFAGAFIDPSASESYAPHVPTAAEPHPPSRYVSGEVDACVYWKTDEEGPAEPGDVDGPDRPMDAHLAAFSPRGGGDLGRQGIRSKMAEMTRQATATSATSAAAALRGGGVRLDPNDPRNAELIELMRRQKIEIAKGGGGVALGGGGGGGAGGSAGPRPVFRVSEFQRDALLINSRYFQSSARRKVLAARNASGALRDPVPLRDEEIAPELFALIEVEGGEDERRREEYKHSGASPQQLEAMHAAAQWKERAKILGIVHEVYSVGEVVNEQPLPDLQLDLGVLDRVFEPRRALKPRREKAKAVSAPKSCRVVIQVVKGQNLPVRRGDSHTNLHARRGAAGSAHGNAVGNLSALSLEAQQNLRPYIEIRCQDNSSRTSLGAGGSNPRWDQIVSLPFHPPAGSFSPAYLSSVTDEIYFNVFDQVEASEALTGADGRPSAKTRLHRTESRWLGSFSIPFTTIYAHGRVDGAFQLAVPPLHLGYEQPHPDRHAFLYIYATLDPLLTPPPVQRDHFQHINPFYARALAWVAELKSAAPGRDRRAYTAVVGDIHGAPQFLTRYVTAEAPPARYQRPNVFARFVSIVPFLADAQVSQGMVRDIWCNSKEFLTLAGGDWEEHAILLNNYFTWYDANVADAGSRHQNFVALGEGFPEGETAYVLRLGVSNGAITSKLLLNAVTGHSYDMLNPLHRDACPLQSLALLFNADNIWANVQAEDDPAAISFDLANPALWRPFFSASFTKQMAAAQYAMKFETIQKAILYTEEPFEYFADRANKIERLVERRFEKWRHAVTRWDYGVCKVLRDMLLSFESHAQGEEGAGVGTNASLALAAERPLAQLSAAYGSVYGFPLHFSDAGDARLLELTDDNPVLKAVRNTRIHESEDSKAVFALAVYIHPYPNRMGSVWLYIACLTDK